MGRDRFAQVSLPAVCRRERSELLVSLAFRMGIPFLRLLERSKAGQVFKLHFLAHGAPPGVARSSRGHSILAGLPAKRASSLFPCSSVPSLLLSSVRLARVSGKPFAVEQWRSQSTGSSLPSNSPKLARNFSYLRRWPRLGERDRQVLSKPASSTPTITSTLP